MSKRNPGLILDDILKAISSILEYTFDLSIDDFCNDKKTIDAVVRNFEIIGEASNVLPVKFKEKYSKINWRQIRGFRNRIVHEYFGIDLKIVWNIIQSKLPELKVIINDIIQDIEQTNK
jgi:uncharacterized protein with HEPN domain